MPLSNVTRKRSLAGSYKMHRSILGKALGLMFRTKLRNHALIFDFKNETRTDLHMLFVFFPIDVLFLNKNREVVEMKADFLPFTYYHARKPAKYVIELPRGTIASSRTALGDRISW